MVPMPSQMRISSQLGMSLQYKVGEIVAKGEHCSISVEIIDSDKRLLNRILYVPPCFLS